MKAVIQVLASIDKEKKKRTTIKKNQWIQEARHLCWCRIPLVFFTMTAFIQLRLRTKNQTWRGFFFSSSSSSVLQTAVFFCFFFQDTTEDPMVLKANTSVSVCDTGLHFREDTNRVFNPPNQAPRRQPSPNQLTSEPSATTWGGQKSRSAVWKTMYIMLLYRQAPSCPLASVYCDTWRSSAPS